MSEKRRKRLFVTTPGGDGVPWYAGAIEDAHRGMANLLQEDIGQLLAGAMSPEEFIEGFDIQVREMTDAEVAALPDD